MVGGTLAAVIDRELKRVLGQMTDGVTVVAVAADGIVRAYTSHWTQQVSFTDPIVALSVSPKHDTHPLIVEAGRVTISILAGDQVDAGQYFSYPGHRFRYVGDFLVDTPVGPGVQDAIGWLGCEVVDRYDGLPDHDLFFVRVEAVAEGRLDEPALTYSSRKGWRIADAPARKPGESVRDWLLSLLDED